MQTINLLQFLSKYHIKVIIKTIQKKSKKITFFDEMILSIHPYFDSLKVTCFELPTSINNHPYIFSNDHFNFQKRKELGI